MTAPAFTIAQDGKRVCFYVGGKLVGVSEKRHELLRLMQVALGALNEQDS